MKRSEFIAKVIVISAVLSFLIKYGGAAISIPSTLAVVLSLVLLPTVVMVIALWWRSLSVRS